MATRKRKATTKYTVKTLTAAVIAGPKRPCVSPTRVCPGLLSRLPLPFLLLSQDATGAKQLKAFAKELNKLINPPGKAKRRKASKRRKVSKRRRR